MHNNEKEEAENPEKSRYIIKHNKAMKKLKLNKETVERLTHSTMSQAKGGDEEKGQVDLFKSRALCLTVTKWETDCGGSMSCDATICIPF